jgi:phospholipid-transporting ATPase
VFRNDYLASDGKNSGLWVWGTTLYLAILLTVLGKAALISEYDFARATLIVASGPSIHWLLFPARLHLRW